MSCVLVVYVVLCSGGVLSFLVCEWLMWFGEMMAELGRDDAIAMGCRSSSGSNLNVLISHQ